MAVVVVNERPFSALHASMDLEILDGDHCGWIATVPSAQSLESQTVRPAMCCRSVEFIRWWRSKCQAVASHFSMCLRQASSVEIRPGVLLHELGLTFHGKRLVRCAVS